MLRRFAFAVSCLGLACGVAWAQRIGPSTTTPPYLLPNPDLPVGSVVTVSLLSAGDTVGGYRLVGLPDGLGAWSDDGLVQLLMNHELDRFEGGVRAHGATGSFVSRYVIDPLTLAVVSGRDHNTAPGDVHTFDKGSLTWSTGPDAWQHFCSGDLAQQSAFHYRGYGTARRLYLNGEETRVPFTPEYGRAYAHVATGPDQDQTWELPSLGRVSNENVLACPYPQMKTIVMQMDDADVGTTPFTDSPSELYLYVGLKNRDGVNDIERAGLTGGTLYGIQVSVGGAAVGGESDGAGFGSRPFVGSGRFVPVPFGDVTSWSGTDLQTAARSVGLTRFQRTEDGAWDHRHGHQNDFYFVTTATFNGHSRLFRLRFDDITRPEIGGSIEILLNGSEGQRMFDNITVDPLGRIVLLEDVGGNPRLGKVWLYDTASRSLLEVAAFDPSRFLYGGADFLTEDEESSGVIEAFSLLGPGWYLLDAQAHAPDPDPEIVEEGQLLALYIDPSLGRGTPALEAHAPIPPRGVRRLY